MEKGETVDEIGILEVRVTGEKSLRKYAVNQGQELWWIKKADALYLLAVINKDTKQVSYTGDVIASKDVWFVE